MFGFLLNDVFLVLQGDDSQRQTAEKHGNAQQNTSSDMPFSRGIEYIIEHRDNVRQAVHVRPPPPDRTAPPPMKQIPAIVARV